MRYFDYQTNQIEQTKETEMQYKYLIPNSVLIVLAVIFVAHLAGSISGVAA